MLRARHIWLPPFVAALLALASALVPRLNVHALPGPDQLALAGCAMPHGTLPELCAAHDAEGNGCTSAAPHGFACRFVGTPGLLSRGFAAAPDRIALAWRLDSARAPPPSRTLA